MRLLAYGLSAACGCAPVGYNYYNTYTTPSAYVAPAYTSCADPCGSVSTWGGETALPTGYSYGYQPYYSPYYVGSAYNSYGYPRHRVRIGLQIEARNHHAPSVRVATRHLRTKVASVPVPQSDPRKHHHYPSKMVATEEN
jgi:hypothetical protein